MNRGIYVISLVCLLLSCGRIEVSAPVYEADVPEQSFDDFGNALIIKLDGDDAPTLEGYRFERLFTGDPEFEQRHREAGLNHWYYAIPQNGIPVTRAAAELLSLPGVVELEKPVRPSLDAIPFNDPLAYRQWHLFNAGNLNPKFKAGSDIDVTPVWQEFTAGSNDVTVAVVDSGIEYNHPDLSGVVLPPGKNGSKSFYWNKLFSPYDYEANRHGTHVAGIIGAINNNGVGTCGIAGGNDGNGGVRIIDCQAIGESSFMYDAFVWAADKGAVIINNSWNSTYESVSNVEDETPSSYKTAIDYFVQYAGTDKNGNQTGPMKGGLVVFSAGNQGWNKMQPSMYEKNVSVGAVGPGGEVTSYTDYGDWVDICAPGGHQNTSLYGSEGSQLAMIYSTMLGSGWYQMAGTSQAAPMVSGVAALIVSRFGKDGFTCDDLRDILISGADRETPRSHTKAIGPMLDAYGSFMYATGVKPGTPAPSIRYKADGTVDVAWKVESYGSIPTYGYCVVYTTNDVALEALDPFNLPSTVKSATVYTSGKQTGEEISQQLSGLSLGQDYRYTVIGFSRNHSFSAGSKTAVFRPKTDSSPVIEANPDGPFTLNHSQSVSCTVSCHDPEGDPLSISTEPGSEAAVWTDTGNGTYRLDIDGSKAPGASYQASITADDGMLSTTHIIIYKILPNRVPVLAVEKNILVPVRYKEDAQALIRCSDADGDPLTISTDPGSEAGVWSDTGDGLWQLAIHGSGAPAGTYTASISADDGHGGNASISINYILKGSGIPVVQTPINNISIKTGAHSRFINLNAIFHDPDDDALSYEIVSCEEPAIAAIEGNYLRLKADEPGVGKVEISASDGFNEAVKTSFLLRGISEDSTVADIYPTAVTDVLLVAAVEPGEAKVEVFSSTGRSLYSKSLEMDPFNPLEIATSGLAPGKYIVKVSGNNGTTKKTIIKL